MLLKHSKIKNSVGIVLILFVYLGRLTSESVFGG